jgi:hypothetical protein
MAAWKNTLPAWKKLVVVECQADIDKGKIQHVYRVVIFFV